MTILFNGRLTEINKLVCRSNSALIFSIEAKYGDIPNLQELLPKGTRGP